MIWVSFHFIVSSYTHDIIYGLFSERGFGHYSPGQMEEAKNKPFTFVWLKEAAYEAEGWGAARPLLTRGTQSGTATVESELARTRNKFWDRIGDWSTEGEALRLTSE